MKNFQRVAINAATMPLLMQLQQHPELWNQNDLRTKYPGTPHNEVDDIWLRFNDLPTYEQNLPTIADEHESINYPAFRILTAARPLVFGLMAYTEGERLGRVMITRVPPGKCIKPHEDSGSHAAYYERFHVVLQAAAQGNMFRSGDEWVHMASGETWWFDNSKEHEVINDSEVDRIHLIVDIRTTK